jgi:hypothetical protein
MKENSSNVFLHFNEGCHDLKSSTADKAYVECKISLIILQLYFAFWSYI